MQELLGVVVEPWEINSARHDKIHDALYGFDEKCILSDEVERYGNGAFDLVAPEEFSDYWQLADADRMLVAGDSERTKEFISGMDISSEYLAFENYTVRGFVNYPDTRDVLVDEVRSMLPFQNRDNLVEENTAFEMLEEMGVPDADVVYLRDIAQPPQKSKYYSNTSL